MINSSKLDKELKEAGIKFSGCNSNGVVFDGYNEIQDRPDVRAVLDAHAPTPTVSKLKGRKLKDLTPEERDEILFGHLLDKNGNIK